MKSHAAMTFSLIGKTALWVFLLLLHHCYVTLGEIQHFEAAGDIYDMVIDKYTGHVYVSAINHLYHLNADLQLLQAVENTPWYTACQPSSFPFPGCTQDAYQVWNNMIIDYDNGHIVTLLNKNLFSYVNRTLRDIRNSSEIRGIPLKYSQGSLLLHPEHPHNNSRLLILATVHN